MIHVVDTIGTGDCLFAAFAIGMHQKAYSAETQHRAAAVIREKVVEFMARSKKFWEAVVVPPLEPADVPRLRGVVPAHVIARCLSYPEPGSRKAYLAIMSTPGVWGGSFELHALSMMYKRRIVIVDTTAKNTYVAAGNAHETPMYLVYVGDCHYQGVILV